MTHITLAQRHSYVHRFIYILYERKREPSYRWKRTIYIRKIYINIYILDNIESEQRSTE